MDQQNQTQSTSDQVKNSPGEMTTQAKQKVNETLDEAKQKANETLGEAKQQAESTVAAQKERAADRLSGVAGALRQTSQELQPQDNMVAQLADSLADQAERLANYLRERDLSDLFNDVRQVAQRQPELFVAGALATGFLLGRFLKSSGDATSTHNNASQYSTQYGTAPSANGGKVGNGGVETYPWRESDVVSATGEPFAAAQDISVTGSEAPYVR
jgi:hypothetical protein